MAKSTKDVQLKSILTIIHGYRFLNSDNSLKTIFRFVRPIREREFDIAEPSKPAESRPV